jgi:hypothetical protein
MWPNDSIGVAFLMRIVSVRLRAGVWACGLVLVAASWGCRGDVVESWEATNHTLKVRVRKFKERPDLIVMPNFHFSFEVAAPQSKQWREIMSWIVDDPIPVQRQQVQFVSERVVYAFGNWQYVVTTDGGRTWSVWDAKRKIPRFRIALIAKVHILPDGTGEMVVTGKSDSEISDVSLSTTDFGVHWRTADGREA